MTKYFDDMGRDVTSEIESLISRLAEAEQWHQRYDALKKRREERAKPNIELELPSVTEEVKDNGN